MPRRDGELIGHTTCPECDFNQAEVRKDRRGHPYRKCANCAPATVYLTQGAAAKVMRLLAKTRPLVGLGRRQGDRRIGGLVDQLKALHGP